MNATHFTDLPATASATERAESAPVEHLTADQCWALAETSALGRLAVQALDGRPDIFPVNYVVHEQAIYIRSAPGSKLMAIVRHPVAAFEIDGNDDGFHWSVVLRGTVRRLSVDREIHESGIQSLAADDPSAKFNYICVTPRTVTGRRFAATKRTTGRSDAAEPWPTRRPGPARPVPIAHLPPLAMPSGGDPHA